MIYLGYNARKKQHKWIKNIVKLYLAKANIETQIEEVFVMYLTLTCFVVINIVAYIYSYVNLFTKDISDEKKSWVIGHSFKPDVKQLPTKRKNTN